MESASSGEIQKSSGSKWVFCLLIVMLVLAAIVGVWLYLGWLITKIVIAAIYGFFEVFSIPVSK